MLLKLKQFFKIIILGSFFIRTGRNLIYHLFLWQVKEYRLDRMIVHLKTSQGRKLLFGPVSALKIFLLFLFVLGLGLESNFLAGGAIWSFGFLFIVEALRNIKEIYNKSLPWPDITLKIVIIISLIFFIEIMIISSSSFRLVLDYLPFLDKALGFMVAFFIGFFSLPARIRNMIKEWLAADKLQEMQNLRVIGVTGSYGKSSTKEFLAQLLSKKYKTVKTPANLNTTAGLVQTILSLVEKETEFFIVETAAYKKGEISRSMRLIGDKLKAGILTGLNKQHFNLFGGFKNIQAAKFELIKALPEKAPAVFNGNNIQTVKLAEKAKKMKRSVFLYGYDEKEKKKNTFTCQAKNIQVSPTSLTFTLVMQNLFSSNSGQPAASIGKKEKRVNISLLGKHNIENILAAALVSYKFGLSFEDIVQEIKKLKSRRHVMDLRKSGRTTIIDNSLYSNPDGVKAAFNHLRLFKAPKILVFQPLIELGKEGRLIHSQIGRLAGKIFQGVVLVNNNYLESFKKGFQKENQEVNIVVKNGQEAKKYINKAWSGGKTILFEGKETRKTLKNYV